MEAWAEYCVERWPDAWVRSVVWRVGCRSLHLVVPKGRRVSLSSGAVAVLERSRRLWWSAVPAGGHGVLERVPRRVADGAAENGRPFPAPPWKTGRPVSHSYRSRDGYW